MTAAEAAPEPLTEAWVARLASTLSGCETDAAINLVVQHEVSDGHGSVFVWHVRLQDGQVTVGQGAADPAWNLPVVRFTSDHRTALAVAADRASAQRAFLDGRIRLHGDPMLLIAAREAMDTIGRAITDSH